MTTTQTEYAGIQLKIRTHDYFIVDDELIIFSLARQEYLGVNGAARLVFDVMSEAGKPLTEREIGCDIGAGQTLTSSDKILIREAIQVLLELGVLYEP